MGLASLNPYIAPVSSFIGFVFLQNFFRKINDRDRRNNAELTEHLNNTLDSIGLALSDEFKKPTEWKQKSSYGLEHTKLAHAPIILSMLIMGIALAMNTTNQTLDTENKSDPAVNTWALGAVIATVLGIFIANISQLLIARNIKNWRNTLNFALDEAKKRQLEQVQEKFTSINNKYQKIREQLEIATEQLQTLLKQRVEQDKNFIQELAKYDYIKDNSALQSLNENITRVGHKITDSISTINNLSFEDFQVKIKLLQEQVADIESIFNSQQQLFIQTQQRLVKDCRELDEQITYALTRIKRL